MADATNANPEEQQDLNTGGAPEGQEQQNQTEKTYTQAEFESEADRRATKAAETAVKNFIEKELPKRLETERGEAEKLAKMNAEEKAKHEAEQREAAIANREKEITRRELKASAFETLAEKGLPKELAEIINYSDAESVKVSLDAVEKTYKAAVEAGINEKLKGDPPKTGQSTGTDTFESALKNYYE